MLKKKWDKVFLFVFCHAALFFYISLNVFTKLRKNGKNWRNTPERIVFACLSVKMQKHLQCRSQVCGHYKFNSSSDSLLPPPSHFQMMHYSVLEHYKFNTIHIKQILRHNRLAFYDILKLLENVNV